MLNKFRQTFLCSRDLYNGCYVRHSHPLVSLPIPKLQKHAKLTRPPEWREITVVLIIKFIIIMLIWAAFFNIPPAQRINTAQQLDAHILGKTPTPVQPFKDSHHD